MQGKDEGLGGCLLLLFAGFVWASWPLCLWFAGACLLAWCLHAFSIGSKSPNGASFLKDLRDTAICVAAGFWCVMCAQVLLVICGFAFSEDSVLSAEKWLVARTAALNSLLSWKVQLPLWAALVAISLWTGIGAVKIYNDRRKLIARFAIVLNVITSFTFLSASTVQGREPEWVAQRTDRGTLATKLDEVREDQQKLVAYAWVDRSIREHPEQERARLSQVFRDTSGKPASETTIEWKTEWLAERATKLPADVVGEVNQRRAASPLEGLLAEARAWTESQPSAAAPTFQQLDQIEEERARVARNLQQAEIALTESLKSLVGLAIPISDGLAKTFVKTATSSLVKTAMKESFPKGVDDLASARDWMNSVLERRNLLSAQRSDNGKDLLPLGDSVPPAEKPEVAAIPLPTTTPEERLIRRLLGDYPVPIIPEQEPFRFGERPYRAGERSGEATHGFERRPGPRPYEPRPEPRPPIRFIP